MITRVHDETLKAGKIFGQAAAQYYKDHPLSGNAKFFQNGPSNDGWVPPARGGRPVNVTAAPEGEEETPAAGRGAGRGRGGRGQ
jgi:hypothetical protein